MASKTGERSGHGAPETVPTRRRCAHRGSSAAVALFLVLASAKASAQAWNYQSYPDGEDITKSSDVPLYSGYITLDESGSTPIFHMYSGKVTKCFSGNLEAKVAKTSETTTIVVRRDLKGCGSARFVLKNDGTGGRREVIRNGEWTWDGLEHGLTLKKDSAVR